MYNDRHWLTDVAAGAGIGILCKPPIGCIQNAKLLFKKETKRQL
jgi:membrane-associated phospholipid phosphatase